MITYATEPHKTRSIIVCWVSPAVLHNSHHRFSEKIHPRQVLTSTIKQPVHISHKCSVDVHQLRLRSHRYQYSPKLQRKTHFQICFRQRSKGPASYSTDLRYRGSVRLHVNATNVLFFLRTFQDERPLYRKLTTSAFQENFNDV